MQPHNDRLPDNIRIIRLTSGQLHPSNELIKLLCINRNVYDWPKGTGKEKSQELILTLETEAITLHEKYNENSVHQFVIHVSKWAGNNAIAHNSIINASQGDVQKLTDSLLALKSEDTTCRAFDNLSNLPGISLVIASKIYRFYCSDCGAAIDRHASYFFNSLDVVDTEGKYLNKALKFKREWVNGKHKTSRLAIYNKPAYDHNRDEYMSNYLPLHCCPR